MEALEKPKEIDIKAFQKWVKKDNFWFEEAPMLILTIEMALRKMVEIHKYFSPGIRFCVFAFEKCYMHQILSVLESIENCKTQFRLLHKKPRKIRQTLKEWDKTVAKLEKKISELDSTNLSDFSNKKLLEEFFRFNKALEDFWSVTLTIEPYTPFLDQYYYPKFEKLVGNVKKAREAFTVLTLPAKPSFIAEERKELLKIAIRFLESNEIREKIFSQTNELFLDEIRLQNPRFFNALQTHQKRFFWLQNSYGEWTVLSLGDFLGFLKDTIKGATIADLKKELEKHEDTQTIVEKQKALSKELKLSQKTLRELDYIRTVSWRKDDRKRVVLMYLHHMFRFIQEFSKRTGIEFKTIGNASIDELPSILEKKLAIDKLTERRNNFCVWITQSGNRQSILTGKEALEFKKRVLEKSAESYDQIQGTIACRGTEAVVTGKAKIVLNPKDQKINANEILVTSMTRPDFLPLMKTAKAFITNEGGITCHAAIVAREMNKPCIIGTQNSTKVLKTGDEIEIRMNHGIVRILRRK